MIGKVIGYNATIKFLDDESCPIQEVYIKVGSIDIDTASKEELDEDEKVFFYIDTPEEIATLTTKGTNDFIVVSFIPVFQELRVYVISADLVPPDSGYIKDESFMNIAEKEGTVYSLVVFQAAFNMGDINSSKQFIRFI